MLRKFVKEYTVKSYEADAHGFLRIMALMNILQDAADGSAIELGFGFEDCWKRGVSWVGSNYLIEINRLPKIHEKFIIETWPAEAKLWGAIRDFIVRDENGNELMRASSQWVLIDINRKRPVPLAKYFSEYKAIEERAINIEFAKAKDFENPETEQEFKVRFDDIDINNHVNNAVYPLWATESVGTNWREKHTPKRIELWFKKEALYGQTIRVLSKFAGDTSIHSITDNEKENELARCNIDWRKI